MKRFTLSQPLPQIWITFSENEDTPEMNKTKIEVSEDARKILYEHWKKSLEFRYITEIEGVSKDDDYRNKAAALLNSTITTENLLLKTPIDTGKVSRNFSANEASQLVIVIRDKADEVISEIKYIQNQKSEVNGNK